MRWRCVFSSILCVAMCLMVGCGSPKEGRNTDPNTLRFAHSETGGTIKDTYDEICAEFERLNPGVRVIQIAIEDEVYQDLGLVKLFAGGNPPDVFFQWGGWLVQRDYAAGRAADLTEYLEKDGWKNEFYDYVWPWTEVDGRIYMIPNTIGITTILWYNVDLLNTLQAGVPETWQEFVEVCRKAKEAGLIPITAGNNDKWVLGNWGAHIISRVAGEELYKQTLNLAPGTKFASPDFIQGLKLLQELQQSGFFNPGVIGLTDEEGQMTFRTGEALFHPIGSWVLDYWINEVPELHFDFINTPRIPGGKGNQESVLGVISGFMMYKECPRKELAIRFLRHFHSVESQRRLIKSSGVFTAVKAAMEGELEPHLAKMRDLAESTPVLVPPGDTGFRTDVARHFYDAINSVVGGLSTPEEALKRCDRRIERLRAHDALVLSGGKKP